MNYKATRTFKHNGALYQVGDVVPFEEVAQLSDGSLVTTDHVDNRKPDDEEASNKDASKEDGTKPLDKMNLAELKAEAEKRKLSTEGFKKDLLARIVEADTAVSDEPTPEGARLQTPEEKAAARAAKGKKEPEAASEKKPVAEPKRNKGKKQKEEEDDAAGDNL